MGELVARSSRETVIQATFKSNLQAMVRSAPRAIVSPDRLIRIALNTITHTPALLDCTVESLMGCVMEGTRLGLEIGGQAGECYMVPFKDNKSGKRIAQFISGYKGMIALAYRNSRVKALRAYPVFEGDEFDYGYGDTPFIKHKPSRQLPANPAAALTATYCVVELNGGGKLLRVVEREEIETHRKRSASARQASSPWNTDYVAMAVKTAIRILYPQMPHSADLTRMVSLDEQADREQPQVFDVEGLVLPSEEEQKPGAGKALDAFVEASQQTKGEAPAEPAEEFSADDIKWGQ